MDNSVVLPLEWSISETYQYSAFIIGVLLANENIKNAYWNNFIGLYCIDTEDIWDVDLKFLNANWEDFRLQGIFEMDLFSAQNFSTDTIVPFIEERLMQKNYVLLHSVDEFYLPYSNAYNERHFLHDAYLYGYDAENFFVLAYANRRLQQLKVDKKSIARGIVASCEREPETSFCSLRPFHVACVKIDGKRLVNDLSEYVECAVKNNAMLATVKAEGDETSALKQYKYGIDIYEVLKKCLQSIADKNEGTRIVDSRPFRLVREHFAIIEERIARLFPVQLKYVEAFNELQKMANSIFLLTIKYNITNDRGVLIRMIKHLDTLQREERTIINEFLGEDLEIE